MTLKKEQPSSWSGLALGLTVRQLRRLRTDQNPIVGELRKLPPCQLPWCAHNRQCTHRNRIVKGKLACANLSPKLLGCGQSGNNASWRQRVAARFGAPNRCTKPRTSAPGGVCWLRYQRASPATYLGLFVRRSVELVEEENNGNCSHRSRESSLHLRGIGSHCRESWVGHTLEAANLNLMPILKNTEIILRQPVHAVFVPVFHYHRHAY